MFKAEVFLFFSLEMNVLISFGKVFIFIVSVIVQTGKAINLILL